MNAIATSFANRVSAAHALRINRSPTRVSIALVLALLVCSISCATAEPSPANFSYLHVLGHSVRTTHSLKYTLTMPSSFRLSQPESRTDTFHGHPFRISLTAFVDTNAAVMLQAETVADHSGASNYENLPFQTLHGLRFHVRPDQCVNLKLKQLTGEHDLEWLDAHGFPPTGPLVLRQFLASSTDHNGEVVISFLQRVPDCSNKTANSAALQKLQERLKISMPTVHQPHLSDDHS